MTKKIILAGEPEELRTAITMIMAMHQMLEGIEADAGNSNWRELNPRRAKKPKLTLEFREVPKVGNTERLKEGEISFRIMNRTSQSLTQQDLERWANIIKSRFATPPLIWNKGKRLYSYTHWELGYQLQILAPNETEARRLVEQTLDIQQHSPDWNNLNLVTAINPESKYPEIAEREVILGKTVKMPQRRPNVAVKFRRATLLVSGVPKPIVLLDLSGKAVDPVVEV